MNTLIFAVILAVLLVASAKTIWTILHEPKTYRVASKATGGRVVTVTSKELDAQFDKFAKSAKKSREIDEFDDDEGQVELKVLAVAIVVALFIYAAVVGTIMIYTRY